MKNRRLLKIFLWAAVHSPDFQFCYINFPFYVRFTLLIDGWEFTVGTRPWFIFIPWSVKESYEAAHRVTTSSDDLCGYDDIPF